MILDCVAWVFILGVIAMVVVVVYTEDDGRVAKWLRKWKIFERREG